MTSRRLRIAIVCALCFCDGRMALASGPELTVVPTFDLNGPAFRAAFAAGDLGIVKPTFTSSDLVFAYRVLAGRRIQPASRVPSSPPEAAELRFWAAVARVSSTPRLEIAKWRSLPDYSTFDNCTDATFATALGTLNARTNRYGATSREVSEWLSGQLDVLRNCSGNDFVLPKEAPAWADATLRADRDYQIASAHFYAMHYAEAARRFLAIAADSPSPWRPYGRYLAARASIRQATVISDAQAPELFGRARMELEGVLSDSSAATLHPSARGLLSLIDVRLRPRDRMRELAVRLATADEVNEGETSDYLWLLRRAMVPPGSDGADLTDWIVTLRGADDQAAEHALSRWRATHSSQWLIAALWKAPPRAAPADLQEAAAAVPRQSPVFATVVTLRLRMLAMQDKSAEALRLAATIPSRPERGVNAEVSNVAKAVRLRFARTFPEFIDNLTRAALPGENHPAFTLDDDAAAAFNRYLPLERWADAAASTRLSRRFRIRFAQVALTRAIVLGRDDVALRVAPILSELAPSVRQDVTRLVQATDSVTRHRAGIVLLLRTPGMTMSLWGLEDNYEDLPDEPHRSYRSFTNYWWCRAERDSRSDLSAFLSGNEFAPPQFLSASERAAAQRDLQLLNQHLDSEVYLTTEVLAWARATPDDPLIPESLSRAIRGWRYVRCGPEGDSPLPRQAFELLHTRYAGSDWARRTRYWYR
jgi:hypothetical protein